MSRSGISSPDECLVLVLQGFVTGGLHNN